MVKIGNQNPTQSVMLPYKVSLYEESIKLYEESERTALPWQKGLMKHILAVNDDGLWAHTKVEYSLPRRNGKNEIVIMRELYGLMKAEQILHTAHRTSTSSSAWSTFICVCMGYLNMGACKNCT